MPSRYGLTGIQVCFHTRTALSYIRTTGYVNWEADKQQTFPCQNGIRPHCDEIKELIPGIALLRFHARTALVFISTDITTNSDPFISGAFPCQNGIKPLSIFLKLLRALR